MLKRLFSFLFAITASGLVISAILIFSALFNLRDDNFLHKAFLKSNFQTRSEEVILETSEQYIRENVKVDEENKIPAKLSSLILQTLIKNNTLDGIYDVAFKTISNSTASWFRGDSELTLFFPKTELIKKYKESGGDEKFISQFIETAAFKDLPDCVSPMQLTDAGLLRGDLPCSGPFLVEFINSFFQEATASKGENFMEGFLNSVFPNLDEKIVISTESDILGGNVGKVQDYIVLISNLAFIAVFLGLLLAGISTYLSKNRIGAIFKISRNIGVFLVLYALIAKVAIRILMDFYFWQKISFSPEVYSQENISLILGLLKDFVGVIIDEILMTTFLIGGIFILLTVILYAISKLKRFKVDEVTEDVEEYLPESDLEEQVFKS